MKRDIKGDVTPDMYTRFYVGRCPESGVVRCIDFEKSCEIVLTIRHMTTLANHSSIFGLTNRGEMSIGTPGQPMRGKYIILSVRNLKFHGCMDDDFETAFQRFVWLVQVSFGKNAAH